MDTVVAVETRMGVASAGGTRVVDARPASRSAREPAGSGASLVW